MLDCNYQSTAANINDNVLNLTRATARDAAAVKILTYLTLFYLPGSFIAVRASCCIVSFG